MESLAITWKKIWTSSCNKRRYQRFKLQSPTDAQMHALEKLTLGAACTLGGMEGSNSEGKISQEARALVLLRDNEPSDKNSRMERTGWTEVRGFWTEEPFRRSK